jgi:hypothetical protein
MIRRILPSIFKVSLMSLLMIAFNQGVTAQTIDITTNPGTSGNVIIGGNVYHASECIFQGSEIGAGNFETFGTAINRVAFSLNAGSTGSVPQAVSNFQIFMKNVPDSVLATGSYTLIGYTQVFNGTFNLTTKGAWNSIDLTTPFVRTAGSNLQILIIRGNGVTLPGYTFDCSIGTPSNSALLTTRRYNGATTPTTTSSLVGSAFRYMIELVHTVPTDVKPTIIALPSSSCYSSNQTVSVTIANSGSTNAISAGAVSVKLNITGPNATSLTQNSGVAIPLGGTQVLTFSNINLSSVGTNVFEVITNLTGDGDNTNDTLFNANATYKTVTSFPATESAESNPLYLFSHVKTLAGASLWTLAPGFNNPNLSDSIPPIDGNTIYVFDNYSSASSSSGYTARLFSDCISLPSGMPASNYQLSYWLTHDTSYSTFKDSIYVSVSTDKGATWTRLAGYSRYDAAFTTADWKKDSISLSAYAGQTIMIGFEGVSKWGNMQGLDLITVNANYPLPITLSLFNGVREGTKNILSWSTSTEVNNKGFELQRSVNGKEFSGIAFVNSKAINGASSSVINYSFTDEKPLTSTNYYRLRQLDKDGKATISNVVVLKSAQIKAEISRVFPNPVQDKLNIVLNTVGTEKVTINITDLVGKVLATKSIETVQGDNNISFNTSSLAQGTYFIKVNSSSNSELATQKFVKP